MVQPHFSIPFELPRINPLDSHPDSKIARAIDKKTNPPGSLGHGETPAAQIARLQRALAPAMAFCLLIAFAGGHAANVFVGALQQAGELKSYPGLAAWG